MSINWRELKAAFLALKTFPNLQHMRILIRTNNTASMSYMNKQGGTRFITSDGTSNNNPVESHSRLLERHRKLRILPTIFEEQLDASPPCIQRYSTTLRQKKNDMNLFADRNTKQLQRYYLGFRIRAAYTPTPYNPPVSVPLPLPQSSLKPDQSMSTETLARESSTGNNGYNLVAERDLVSDDSGSEHRPAITASAIHDSSTDTNSNVADEQQLLETRRVQLTRSKYSNKF